MSSERWEVTFKVYRQKADQAAYFDNFKIEVDPQEYILDGIERIWAYHDRSLVFRHACHHSACGACGMRVNGIEKLTCITPIHEVTRNGGFIKVEPLLNFPVVSDLVVDMSQFYIRMEQAEYQQVIAVQDAPIFTGIAPSKSQLEGHQGMMRLADCIECGLCISACPVALTSPEYLGPAVLAGIQAGDFDCSHQLIDLANSQGGVWRCHSAYECSEVCPSFVEPGWRIMDLRRKIIMHQVRRLFWPQEGKSR